MGSRRSTYLRSIALFPAFLFVRSAAAQVDTIQLVQNGANTVGGVSPSSALGAYGYVPASASASGTDTYYAAGFVGTGQDLRSIATNGTATPTITRLIQATAWVKFDKGGDLSRGGGSPTPGSIVFNKSAIAGSSIGAYGSAFISDGTGNTTINSVVQPNLSQKIYRYNLALDTNGDASDEFTSLVTLGQMQGAITSTSTSTNVSRQVALSTDSSKVYFVDSSTAFGGLWTVNSLGGGVARLVADADAAAEPSVARVNGVDRVYLNGTAATSNAGGLDYYDTSTNGRAVALAASKLADFLETTTANITINSTATDDAGNVYFLDAKAGSTGSTPVPERRGVYRLDPQGRLSKVYGYAERTSVTGGTNANAFRLQTRAATVNGVGITQVLFYEPNAVNGIAAANAFLPGDFNRDGSANQADVALFKTKLTTRGVAVPLADSRYDLNGNNAVDWRDVKALQQFLPIKNGDADMDYDVDFSDLSTLAANYNTAGKTWVQGEFTGDASGTVDYNDLLVLVGNYDAAPAYPTLSVGGVFTQPFIDDYNRAIGAVVPEPTSLAALAGIGILAIRRRGRAKA